ncbi:tetratricopeptide repeat protein [Saccharicrinis sp. 156]|uniref:tetratricopeptide repeat protein n=1 Tax=Saccharicrinis sp. 156 TaxID=3417574 RepID=UPI003D330A56
MTVFIIISLIAFLGVLGWILSANYRILKKGISLFNSKRYDDALSIFTELKEKKYDKALAWLSKTYFAIGETQFENKQYEAAILSFDKSSEKNAKSCSDKAKAHILYQQALPFYEQDDYKTVISIIDNFPCEPAQSLYQKSQAHINIESYNELYQLDTIDGYRSCQELAEQIVSAFPERKSMLDNAKGEIAYLEGIEYYQNKQFTDALACFKKSIEKEELKGWLRKSTDEVIFENGSVQFKEKEFLKAQDSFREITEDSHKYEAANLAIANCQVELDFIKGVNHFDNKDYNEAAKVFKSLLEVHAKASSWLEKTNNEIELLKGIRHFEQGELQNALNTFTECKHQEAELWLVKTNDEIKFENALNCFNENKFGEALRIIDSIVNELPKALSLKSDCEREVEYLRAESYYEEKNFTECLPIYSALKDDLPKAKKKLTKLKSEIYAFAKLLEKEFKYNESIELYDLILSFYPKHKVAADINCRKLIVKIKLNQEVTIEEINATSINDVTEALTDDLKYRWLVQNYQKGEFETVAKYLPKLFPDYRTQQALDKLINEINLFYHKVISDKIETLNSILRNDFSYEEMKEVYAKFEEYYQKVLTEIDTILEMPILEGIEIKFLNKNLGNLKSKLFKELVNTGIHEGDYTFIFNLIKKEDIQYFRKHSLLNNVAICCFQLVANGQLNTKHYKEIISTWLSSVYLDDLMISSLENTSWDDEHQFTIEGTIGWLSDKSLLDGVENISVSGTTNAISIKESQTALVKSFEKEISAYSDDKIKEFYKEEAEAITELIKRKNTFNNNYIAAPYFTHAYSLNKPIVDNLIALYNEDNNELNLLNVASKYVNSGYKPELIKDFLKISKGEESLLDAYRNLKPTKNDKIKTAKMPYNKFPVMATNLEKQIINIFTSHKEKHQYSEQLWDNTYQLFSVLPKSKKLAYSFADYTNRLVVKFHNNNEINGTKALTYLNKVLKWEEDEQAKRNALQFIATFLLQSVVEKGGKISQNDSKEIFRYLDKYPAHDDIAEFLLPGMVVKNYQIEKFFKEIESKYPGKSCYKELKANVKMQHAIKNINESKWDLERAFNTFLDGMEIAVTNISYENMEPLFNAVFQEAFQGDITQSKFESYIRRIKRLRNRRILNTLNRIYNNVISEIGITNYQFHSLISDVENGNTYGYQPEGIRMARIIIALKNAA